MEKIENKNLKISILIPCYNVENFIRECLNSVLSQSYQNLEVLCLDDGSKDKTSEILDEYATLDDRVRVFHKKNSGYGDTMNLGLNLATGEYIGIVEGDDTVESRMFEILLKNAIKYELDVSRCTFTYVYPDKTIQEHCLNVPKNKLLRPIDAYGVFLQPPSIWCAIYKKDFLKKNNIQFLKTPGASFQDTSFIWKVYFKAERFYLAEFSGVNYRQHGGNSVTNTSKEFCICEEWEEIINYFNKDPQRFLKCYIPVFRCFMNTYRWNYNRISRKSEFVRRWSLDVKRFFKSIPHEHNLRLAYKLEPYIIRYIPSLYTPLYKLKRMVK